MAELKADVLVLGAGMVGVGAALHLQKRGRDVILLDRQELAGEGTSFGNAGIIESASVFPYMFPRDAREILRYALNRSPQAHYSITDLPIFLPWLVRRRDPFSGTGICSRPRRVGQGLCRAVQAQGRAFRRRRCENARTGGRRLARERRSRPGERPRSRGGARTMVRSGVWSAGIFNSIKRQARLPSAFSGARQCRAQSSG